MRDYELIVIFRPQLNQEELAAAIEQVKNLIESTGGAVHKTEPWGLRRLAYPIRKEREGQYVFLATAIAPRGLAEIERGLKLDERVIRHLLVRVGED